MTCRYCEQKAVYKVRWADGRAIIPVCSAYTDRGRKAVSDGRVVEASDHSSAESKARRRAVFLAESEAIASNKAKDSGARRRHKFVHAKWTHPNGHPRCLRCGNEEEIGGYCHGTAKDHARGHKEFDTEMRKEWIEKNRAGLIRSGNLRRRLGVRGFWRHIAKMDARYDYEAPETDPVWKYVTREEWAKAPKGRYSQAFAKTAQAFLAELLKTAAPPDSPEGLLAKAQPGDIVLTWPREPGGSLIPRTVFTKVQPWVGGFTSGPTRGVRGSHAALYVGNGKILDLRADSKGKRLREKKLLNFYRNHEISLVRPLVTDEAKRRAVRYYRAHKDARYDFESLGRLLRRRIVGPTGKDVDPKALDSFVCSPLIAAAYYPALGQVRPGVGPLETLPIDFARSRKMTVVARTRTGGQRSSK